MKWLLALLLLFLPALPAHADDKSEEPKNPAEATSEAERATARKRATELNQQLVALYRQGKVHEALALGREALGIRERVLGPEHADVAESLNNLAFLFQAAGSYKEARPLYERALKINEMVLGPEHPQVAAALNNLAQLLRIQGAYAQARPHFERALRIIEKALGSGHPQVALCLNNLAVLLKEQGLYKEARLRYERALKIFENALGPEHPAVAPALDNLALLLQAQGAYEEARALFERALRISQEAHGPGHPDVAQVLNNLALLLQAQGAYEEARPRYERALKIWQKVLGPEHPQVAVGLNNLASLLQQLGLYEEARPRYERALKINEKALGREHPDVASILNNLAGLLKTQGAYDEARPILERTLKIAEKTLGPEHPDVAQSLNNLAGLLQDQGASEGVRPLYERALKIWEKVLGPEHPEVAAGLNNLAELLRSRGAYDEARPLYERALTIDERASGRDHPDVATDLNNLALVLQAQGAYDEARLLFERALKIREDVLGPDHPYVAGSLNNLAGLLIAHGDYQRAAPLLERALGITERHLRRGLTALQGTERLARERAVRWYLGNWLRIAPHLDRSGYAEVLRFAGLVSRATAAERRLAAESSGDMKARVSALRVAERRLARIANAPPRDAKKKAAWQQAYAQAANKREDLALALQREFAPLRAGLERLDLGLPDIAVRLGKDAVLLDYLRSGDTYIVWIVRAEGEPERIDVGAADAIEAATTDFVEAAADKGDDEWRKAGHVLRERVFTPIAKHLKKDIRTIHVCPDAALAAVPFAALPGPNTGRLLGEDYLISNVSMAQDLVPWRDAPEAGAGALLLGGVDYGEAAGGDEEVTATAYVDRAPRGRPFKYLPGTKAEAETLRMHLGEGTQLLLGKEATENRVRAGARGKRILHLATHGFVRDDLMRGLKRRKEDRRWLGAGEERQLAQGHDPMLLAGLALAGANPRTGGRGDDGILTALEASYLHLDGVELVVLSACQTALGKAESGEGVVGLVQGFQMAGAKRVIGSLWDVDDEATRALMVRFYELRRSKQGKGSGAAEQLREAQAYVRSHPKWKHPYYWAAWVLWGLPD